jgi:hypothetical protein
MMKMKMILKAKILETLSAKGDNFLNSNMTVFFIMMNPNHICITKPLIVIAMQALKSEIN